MIWGWFYRTESEKIYYELLQYKKKRDKERAKLTSSYIPKYTCNQSHNIKPSYYTKKRRTLNRNILKPHNKRENYGERL